jgi:TDG/mug DNA glycosylase family protein
LADAETVAVYRDRAHEWAEQRSGVTDDIDSFVARLRSEDRPVLDLGCGPGQYLAHLPDGSIGLDAVPELLGAVASHSATAMPVLADLARLPFRRESLGAAWANKSLVHLPRPEVPMALWDLHRTLRVGAPVTLGLFAGDQDFGPVPDDDFPGRRFSLWSEPLLRAVVEGAGFSEVQITARGKGRRGSYTVEARRDFALADTVGPGMRMLVVGLNPSILTAERGIGFVRPGNRFWPAMLEAGLVERDRDPVAALRDHGIGMTNLALRPTRRADEIAASEFRAGAARLDLVAEWLRPDVVCVVGITGWRTAVGLPKAVLGWQERRLGGRPTYVMPNPSGLNAHTNVADLAAHLRTAAEGP